MNNNQEIRTFIKTHLSSVYGMMITKDERELIRNAYREGTSKAVYTDSAVIDGTDKTLCFYDHAKELLK